MLTNLQTRLKKASHLLPVALLPFAAHAQFNYGAANAVTVAGTYTDLGTGGTAIATSNPDDANSTAQPIGFTFNYNGTAFTQFILNTNGLIKLGSVAPSTAALYYENFAGGVGIDPLSSAAAAETNLIMPFNFDLEEGISGTADFRVQTTGTAPNRVCTIQWKNVKDKSEPGTGAPAQYSNFSFQAKLYESGNIEFVYNTALASANATATRFPNVGLKGSSTATNQVALALKGVPSDPWSATTFISQNYGTSAHNINKVGLPDAGRTYRFVPTVQLSNDAAVTAIYTLGTVSSAYGSPVTAQALVTNTGSAAQTNLAVTLAVSGATTYTNTQTVATLAPGASTMVTFTYPVAGTTGTNTLTVTIPADGLASNNTQTFTQTISTGTLSYVSGTTINGGAGVGAAGSVLAVGYRTVGAAAVTSVSPSFAGTTTATATYQVLVYSAAANGQPGTVLYTSPARPRPAGAANVVTTETVAIPNIAVNGGFFVGLKTVAADNLSVAYQTEVPLRSGTFFYTTTNGTTWIDINTSTLNSRLAVNVGLSTFTAVRNEALAATVSLYPNPAHQSFQLTVPTGLRTASATLSNTLGQVVQSRQLNLPAAGGTADFNVSSLAPGVYTLTLKSGADLVVKRVVVE
ncbi:T9SS type A sorting domain-containing protein [Hymenobacter siberiensis]|uniref:T9SS type A sorting domain-containing protein n=1 Tax=Hymenobacter siberiensis TaxID=2848396 RepID=UPI001C1E185E|nr:T9SS type A sorting domain-containing protein [Hymenobacter siberiensis]MBU6119374.1 T9SS type A sorting domain-containing protein [Hymenobacter siberiensis]